MFGITWERELKRMREQVRGGRPASIQWQASQKAAAFGQRAVKMLNDALFDEDSSQVRMWAADALGIIKGEHAVSSLVAAIMAETDGYVISRLAENVCKCGDKSAVPVLLRCLKTREAAVAKFDVAAEALNDALIDLGDVGGVERYLSCPPIYERSARIQRLKQLRNDAVDQEVERVLSLLS